MSTSSSDALSEPLYLPRIAGKQRLGIHITLLALTLVTTTAVGAGLALTFQANRPLTLDDLTSVLLRLPGEPLLALSGLPFSLTLMSILLAHEMGHYLACRHYRIDATLPYFLPFPSLIGTLGAFIRIRSPIFTRKALFDVGIAGPIAGFAMLLPIAIAGVAMSHVAPGIATRSDFVFSTPLLMRAIEALLFPGVAVDNIYLHPVARAAWVGFLATALNLLPAGQLDGGHIVYAFFGRWHKLWSRIFVVFLVVLGFVTGSLLWYVWAVLLLFALRHPVICDEAPLDSKRKALGWLALAMLVLSFTPNPLR